MSLQWAGEGGLTAPFSPGSPQAMKEDTSPCPPASSLGLLSSQLPTGGGVTVPSAVPPPLQALCTCLRSQLFLQEANGPLIRPSGILGL